MNNQERFFELLNAVTVDCKDDGERFTVADRIGVIERLLEESVYFPVVREPLALLYAKRPLNDGDRVMLISSHVDCVYSKCFCSDEGDSLRGTFDNSFGNASVLWSMLGDALPDNVVVAFTGDEEHGSNGALQAMTAMAKLGCSISFALVQDVTNEGWKGGALFALENDRVDLLTAYAIISTLAEYSGKFAFCHNAEPDESWDYAAQGIPAISLCLPVCGDMHSDDGVVVRKRSAVEYCKVLQMLACLLTP